MKGIIIMRLTPPKKNVFWIATIIAVLGILGEVVPQYPIRFDLCNLVRGRRLCRALDGQRCQRFLIRNSLN